MCAVALEECGQVAKERAGAKSSAGQPSYIMPFAAVSGPVLTASS